jgi:dimethylamine/trimethylamine dehydrogenase
VSEFTDMTMEQHRIQSGLLKMGVHIHTGTEIGAVHSVGSGLMVGLRSVYADALVPHQCKALLMVTMRDPHDALFHALTERQADWESAGIRSVQLLGDAHAPGTVAAAVYAGHRAARDLDAPELPLDAVPFRREMIAIGG